MEETIRGFSGEVVSSIDLFAKRYKLNYSEEIKMIPKLKYYSVVVIKDEMIVEESSITN